MLDRVPQSHAKCTGLALLYLTFRGTVALTGLSGMPDQKTAIGLRFDGGVILDADIGFVRLARRVLSVSDGKGRTSSEAPDSHRSRERATWRFLDESEELVEYGLLLE